MKKMQNTCAVALAFSMILTSASIAQTDTVSAAKLKLSKTKATLTVGKTLKLKVKGAKKVKWSSNNSGVASVSSKGVVKAKRVGSAKITAKVKKKKLTCKITVKGNYKPAVVAPTVPVPTAVPQVAAPTPAVTQAPNVTNNTNTISSSTLAENLGVVTQQLAGGTILFTVTNNNSVAVSNYQINYQLKTSDNKVITTDSTSGRALNPGESQYLLGYIGSNNDSIIVDVSKSTISKSVDTELTYSNVSNSIRVTQDSSDSTSIISYTATSTDAEAWANIVCLFYDASGKVVGASESLVSFSDNLTVFSSMDVPYSFTNGDYLTYSSVKFFVYGYK